MLTRQGWLVAAGAVGLIAGGRVLGLPELYALGAVAGILLIACAVLVGFTQLDLQVGRTVQPLHLHVGTPARVDLNVRNARKGRTPVLRLRDAVSGTRGADLLLPPLDENEASVAAYRLPTARRGLLRIGPLRVDIVDPFGLTTLTTDAAPPVEVTVYPHVDDVPPLPYTVGHDPLAGVRQNNSLGRTGEDFYALRPYVVGDDLRRVHWPSSARHDELLVRQHELPWQGRTTVLLDVRKAAHSRDSLELAVSAAASVVTAAARRNDLIRLITTGGTDSDFAPGHSHLDAIMEHLAVVQASGDASLRRVVELLGRRSTGGSLIAVVGEVPDPDVTALQRLRPRFGALSIVRVDRSAWDASGPEPGAGEAPGIVLITRARPFSAAWADHVARSRASVRAASRVEVRR